MPRFPLAAVGLCLSAVLVSSVPLSAAQFDHDDCDARFIAFIGSSAYQFSPTAGRDLGSVRLFTILSYQAAAAHRAPGQAFWRLTVRGPGDAARVVLTARGSSRIETDGQALAEHWWDG